MHKSNDLSLSLTHTHTESWTYCLFRQQQHILFCWVKFQFFVWWHEFQHDPQVFVLFFMLAHHQFIVFCLFLTLGYTGITNAYILPYCFRIKKKLIILCKVYMNFCLPRKEAVQFWCLNFECFFKAFFSCLLIKFLVISNHKFKKSWSWTGPSGYHVSEGT